MAKYPEDAAIADRLVRRAEEAMHQAKARRRQLGRGLLTRERRNYIRFDVSRKQVTIQVKPADGTSLEPLRADHAPSNISRSGLLFESDTAYAIGDEVVIVCEDGATRDA